MRLLATLRNQEQALHLSRLLSSKNIFHKVEIVESLDWGSEDYKDPKCTLWVVEEEDFPHAEKLLEQFLSSPQTFVKKAPLSSLIESKESLEKMQHFFQKKEKVRRSFFLKSSPLTNASIAICVLLFLLSNFYTSNANKSLAGLPTLITSPISRWFLFDYPQNWTLLVDLAQKYGVQALDNPQLLPSQGKLELEKFFSIKQWSGIYPQLVEKMKDSSYIFQANAPLFQKIREGQLWRLVSPAFLHFDLFHIFFNMIWALFLGRQIEWNIGPLRYIVLILIAACISNTAQYLMSGPSFLGYSGVVCAFVGFIWVRQKKAPQERYFLEPSTAYFIFLFIGALALVQTGAFFIDVFLDKDFTPPIANTAHIAGGITGALLALTPFFKSK